MFWIMVVVLIATNIVFVIWGSGEVQPWNDPARHFENNDKAEDTNEKKKNDSDTKVTFSANPDHYGTEGGSC